MQAYAVSIQNKNVIFGNSNFYVGKSHGRDNELAFISVEKFFFNFLLKMLQQCCN